MECSQTCGKCHGGEECHHVTGNCSNGCDPGMYGEKCVNGNLMSWLYLSKIKHGNSIMLP